MAGHEKLHELERRNRLALAGGGPERVRKQHEAGKLTARERIEFLLDAGSFQELDRLVTHRCRDFGMDEERYPATAWSPASAGSMAGRSTSSPRTSRCWAAPWARPTPARSARSWTWP